MSKNHRKKSPPWVRRAGDGGNSVTWEVIPSFAPIRIIHETEKTPSRSYVAEVRERVRPELIERYGLATWCELLAAGDRKRSELNKKTNPPGVRPTGMSIQRGYLYE